jgi:hypothetical protein
MKNIAVILLLVLAIPVLPAYSDTAIPQRVRKEVMWQLNIVPKNGGEIITLSAYLDSEYPNGDELWRVSVTFRLFQGGPEMSIDTRVSTNKWDEEKTQGASGSGGTEDKPDGSGPVIIYFD